MIDFLLTNLEVLLLVAFGLGAVVCAAAMILMRQPMRVAMALIATMVCLGAVYGLLGVHFIAAFQVLIYVGAVMVFMVYAIMLLGAREQAAAVWARRWPLGVLAFVLLLGLLVGGLWQALPPARGEASDQTFTLASFAAEFLSTYWLHFELTSVLLLVAVAAALAIIKLSRPAPGGKRHG